MVFGDVDVGEDGAGGRKRCRRKIVFVYIREWEGTGVGKGESLVASRFHYGDVSLSQIYIHAYVYVYFRLCSQRFVFAHL